MAVTLGELARRFGGRVRGDSAVAIHSVATLEAAGPHDIVFVAGAKYHTQLAATAAGAVILNERDATHYTGNALITENPRLCFTRVAALLHPLPAAEPGVHPSAVVDRGAIIAASAILGPHAVVEADARIGDNVEVGAGCYIGRGVSIGDGTRLHARATVLHACVIGKRCILHSGAVIGSDGFGYATDAGKWVKTPQLGRVVIGDDVEIGANTTIDRGSLGDTVIEDGVKLDNLIQIAHNVRIGEDTAVAACVGIAGSTRVGKRCTLAGQVGVVGHIEICDDVHVTGAAVVSHSISRPGTYSSGTPLEQYQSWLRNAARIRHLDDMAKRLRKLEQKIQTLSQGGNIE